MVNFCSTCAHYNIVELKGIFWGLIFIFSLSRKSGLWDSFWHYKYGNCYSFNKVRGLTAGGPGPSYGKTRPVVSLHD